MGVDRGKQRPHLPHYQLLNRLIGAAPWSALLLLALLSAACSEAPPTTAVPPPSEPVAPTQVGTEPSTRGPSASPNPTALVTGRDWELLADQIAGGDAGSIEVLVTESGFTSTWLRRYPTRAVPEVRLPDPIFAFFNILVQAECPWATMDALVLDRPSSLMYGVFTRRPLHHCGDVGGAHTFVVAVERSALPSGPLTIRLEREFEVCVDCGRDSEQIEIDL